MTIEEKITVIEKKAGGIIISNGLRHDFWPREDEWVFAYGDKNENIKKVSFKTANTFQGVVEKVYKSLL